MPTPRRLRFVFAHVAWLLGALFALFVLGVFSYGLFVLLAVLGFVVVTDLSTLSDVRPRWHGPLRWFVSLGLVCAAITIGARLVQVFAA